MHDRRDRTSWTYQVLPNLAPPIRYAESGGVPACHPPPSSHMLSAPIAHSLLPSSQYHPQVPHRFSTAPVNSATLLASFRCPPTQESTSEQNCLKQQQHHHKEHLARQHTLLPPSFTMMTETWFGLVQTPRDAYLLLEACRVGLLYRITRRLTDLERSQIIRPGAIFVWEEKEAGIKRWTDHVRWSPSRVSGAFLIYTELLSASSRKSYAYPSDPLLKQSFSSTTLEGDRLHLIAYYSKSALDSGQLPTPSADDRLRSIVVPPGVYPDHRATIIDDPSSRDRLRSILLPRNSIASSEASYSVPSSNSLDSVPSSLDTPHIHPVTPIPLVEVSCHRPCLSLTSHPHPMRSISGGKCSSELAYASQQNYYGHSLFPVVSRLSESQAPHSESSRWDALPSSMPNWKSRPSNAEETADTTQSPAARAYIKPTRSTLTNRNPPSLGAWKGVQEREKAENRLSAPTIQPTTTHVGPVGSGNNYNYHPYSRVSDREHMVIERRMDGGQRDSLGFSSDSPTAPGMLARVDTLALQDEKSKDSNSTSYILVGASAPTTNSPRGDGRISRISAGHSPGHETCSAMHTHTSASQTPSGLCLPVSNSQEDLETYPSPKSNSGSVFSTSYSASRFPSSSINRQGEVDPSQSPKKKLHESLDSHWHHANHRPPSINSDENLISNLLSGNQDVVEEGARFFAERESDGS